MKGKVITKILTILFLMMAVMALPLVSVPTVSAKTLKYIVIQSIWDWGVPGPRFPDVTIYWIEDVYTLDGRHVGIIYDWGSDKSYAVGKVEHFFEWQILIFDADDGGGWISGPVEGVWSLVTFKARCNCIITDASPDRVGWIGCKMHSEGVTSNPDDSFDAEGNWYKPVTGTSTCFFTTK